MVPPHESERDGIEVPNTHFGGGYFELVPGWFECPLVVEKHLLI